LIIRFRVEGGIFPFVFRADRFPEIVGYLWLIMLGVDDCGLHIQQVTD